MKRMRLLPLLLGVVFFSFSCRKDPLKNMTESESRVYITEHDSTISFNNFQTFKIADSVSVIRNGRLVRRDKGAYDAALIDAITASMVQRGFRQVAAGATPDIGVNVTKIVTDYTGVVSYNDYWGGYGGYWDPYDWGYGGYDYYFPYSFGVYTFREGAVSVDMVNLKNPDTVNNRLNTVWTGLARGSGIFNTAVVNEIVQSLFSQSTYLQQ